MTTKSKRAGSIVDAWESQNDSSWGDRADDVIVPGVGIREKSLGNSEASKRVTKNPKLARIQNGQSDRLESKPLFASIASYRWAIVSRLQSYLAVSDNAKANRSNHVRSTTFANALAH